MSQSADPNDSLENDILQQLFILHPVGFKLLKGHIGAIVSAKSNQQSIVLYNTDTGASILTSSDFFTKSEQFTDVLQSLKSDQVCILLTTTHSTVYTPVTAKVEPKK